jgi:hypothetical protein
VSWSKQEEYFFCFFLDVRFLLRLNQLSNEGYSLYKLLISCFSLVVSFFIPFTPAALAASLTKQLDFSSSLFPHYSHVAGKKPVNIPA